MVIKKLQCSLYSGFPASSLYSQAPAQSPEVQGRNSNPIQSSNSDTPQMCMLLKNYFEQQQSHSTQNMMLEEKVSFF